ncbi:MAG: 4'-phosphopantetheinyl transferase superfamily protein [Coxiella endosymbiont of Haemaphysalis qinghaiensis]
MNKHYSWKDVARPSLKEGEVHVWKVFLDWPLEEIGKRLANLSSKEKACAQRLVNSLHRCYYIASHAALRSILTLYLSDPAPLQFRYNKHGKPYLINEPSLYFNLSDSHRVALYAITTNVEVGVDIESMRSNIHAKDIAERFFSPNEIAAFRTLPKGQHLEGFYRIWTMKEAYIKVIGRGLSFGLDQFTTNINVDSIKMDGLLTVEGDSNLARWWTLCSISSPPGYMAALAIEGSIKKICYFSWSPIN